MSVQHKSAAENNPAQPSRHQTIRKLSTKSRDAGTVAVQQSGKRVGFRMPILSTVWVILLCVVCVMTVWNAVPVAYTQDSWLHIGVGKFIVEHKRIPVHGDISYKVTTPAFEWVTDSWLADTILFLTSSLPNAFGPMLLCGALVGISVLVAFDIGLLLGTPAPLLWLGTMGSAIASGVFWRMHPFIFQPPLFLIMANLAIRFVRSPRIIYQILLVSTIYVWANLSGGFSFIPLLLLLLMLVANGLFHVIRGETHAHLLRVVRTSVGMAVAAVAAVFLTPGGVRVGIYNLSVIGYLNGKDWYSSLAGALDASFSSVIKAAPTSEGFIVSMIIIILTTLLLCYLLLTHARSTIRDLLPVLPMVPIIYLPLVWIRFIPLSLTVGIPVTAYLIAVSLRPIPRLHSVLPFVAMLSGILLTGTVILPRSDARTFAPPSEQFDLIVSRTLPRPLLTSIDLVGYAFWRLYPEKGYIDIQDYLFDEHDTISVFSAYTRMSQEQFDSLKKTYNFASVLATKEHDYLTGYLSARDEWTLVYLDYNGLLFTQTTLISPSNKLLALPSLDFTTDTGVRSGSTSAAIRELEGFTAQYPRSTLAVGQLASLYRMSGQLKKAEATLGTIPQHRWNYVVKTEMGRIKAAEGLCKQAEGWFLDALRERDEKNISRTTFDLAILYAICIGDIPKAKHYFARYTSYPIPKEERERATQIMKKYVSDIDTAL